VTDVLGEGNLANIWIVFYHTLDKLVCSHLAAIFGMQIWHPTNKGEVDALLAAQMQFLSLIIHFYLIMINQIIQISTLISNYCNNLNKLSDSNNQGLNLAPIPFVVKPITTCPDNVLLVKTHIL
jgi:hypothetical protein